ncbi:type IX secretion system periplasmic lipoprotein PorW/SprE [Neolewinella maritima]|uniref:type IX secretion system periplasmic lipoprotein PorW/SprE n=1 Tax=Neolewinella maritima TaxID=1383882 RepID=UPI001EE89C67|nr:tetratricopeptide repeat protein [Neolewinella maritima]
MALQLVFISCKSTKSREEQGAIAKLWHNTNAHYNGYFNAREIMDETLLVLNEQHADNYNQRLEMFPFLAAESVAGVSEELDRAIEKVAIVVKKHPYSNWTDDSYLLVGQAQLIKQDYESAERTLSFAATEFRPRPPKKKVKKGQKADESEEEFESRREVESSQAQSRRDQLQARRDAQRERQRTIKQRDKERKEAQREREKERKEKIRNRKRGIRTPTKVTSDTTQVEGLDNEPDPVADELFAEAEEGPVGMISIFGNRNAADADGGEYGKKSGSYILKHRPAHQEIRLWLAWTLIKRDNFDRAQIILDDLRNDRSTYASVRRKAIAVQAYYYLQQQRPEEAIPYLEAAAEVAEERNERARYYYIAGQLYQELNQPGAALAAFEQVVAAKPAYEFELGARINMAQNAYLSGSGSPDEAIRQLERMAREEKNLEYESQLYYAMAGIAMRSGDDAGGADYLRRALDSPYGGGATRIEAYQLLGDMAYGQEDYLPAKRYYDSTLQVMADTDGRYFTTSDRRDRLSGVARSLEEITLRDSLLRIGTLAEPDRRRWAEEVFELRRATNSAANFSTPATQGSINIRNPAASASTLSGSSFWGYDNQVIRRGSRDFSRTWGDRSLEDNWRRSNRTDASLFTDVDDNLAAGAPSNAEVALVTEEEINAILADIPVDAQTQATMRDQLADAYFTLGREYRDRVENNARAIEAFETLDRKFPGSKYEAESWYYLYLLHTTEKDAAAAGRYAARLAENYPDSKFARLANDPSYAQQLVGEAGQRARMYEVAYQAFEQENYARANQLITGAMPDLPEGDPLLPRYALLQAMVTGKLEGRAAYISSLQQLVAQYNDTPEQTRAREILRLLGETGARLPGRATAVAGGKFRESMDEIHYVLVVFDDREAQLNELKDKLEAYNEKYNKTDRLRSTPIFIGQDNEVPVLVLRRFKTGQDAQAYYRSTQQHQTEFLNDVGQSFTVYPVSQTNYREILKARSFDGYGDFFQSNY